MKNKPKHYAYTVLGNVDSVGCSVGNVAQQAAMRNFIAHSMPNQELKQPWRSFYSINAAKTFFSTLKPVYYG